MAKLIELHEAAEMLGITPEELTDMRSRNEIFGYRDGSTWKFKQEEIERVRNTLGGGAAGVGSSDESDFEFDLDLSDSSEETAIPPALPAASGSPSGSSFLTGDEETISLDDLDLGAEGSKAASGVGSPGASDLQLDALDSGLDLSGDDADVIDEIEADDSDSILVSEEELGQSDENTASTIIGEPDDLALEGSKADDDFGESDLDLSLGTSDVLVSGESRPVSASDTANLAAAAAAADADDDLKLQSDSGALGMELDDVLDSGSKIELADDIDAAKASSSGFGSAIDLGLDDDELVLGSGTGSDVTSGAGDSGINLANPADSGLSLEDPLELSAGSDAESLELGEDDMLELDDTLSVDSGQGDDDFMLEPVAEGLDDESDSGSQVIALDSEELDAGDGGMFAEEEAAFGDDGAGFDEEDADELGAGAPAGFAAAGAAATGAAIAGAHEEEANYTIANVMSLFGIVLVLGFTGILLVDLINNIWSWGGNYSFNSTIMDAILNMLPG